MKSENHSNNTATEQYSLVVLFVLLFLVVLTFEFVKEILKCDC